MAVYAPRIVKEARPGQFVHLRCSDSKQPLLRRPFSFHRINKNSFEILYKIVGRGTNLLAKKHKGDKIDILGPLGNGFDLKHPTRNTQSATILVAGGMGVAPLLSWAGKIVNSPESIVHRKKLYVLIGAKTKAGVLCEKDFKKLKAKVFVSTEDGSQGSKGLVTNLLKFLLSTIDHRPSTIYTCGPLAMLKEVARIGRDLHIAGYASLEERMACGVGACLGCAVGTSRGYKLVCKDGPVFNLQEIKW